MDVNNKELLETIVLITGRELSILNTLYSNNDKVHIVNELLEKLKFAQLKEERFELVNRVLIVIGIPPTSKKFFEAVFRSTPFDKIGDVKECVNRIRCVYLLEHGNFYYGYRKLRDNDPLPIITKYFSQENEREELIDQYQRNRHIPAFENIDVGQRYSLGYLAGKENKEITEYRKKLTEVLEEGIKKGANDPNALRKIAKDMGYEGGEWDKIVLRAGTQYHNGLLHWRTVLGYNSKPEIKEYSSFIVLMQDAKKSTKVLTDEDIEAIRGLGRKNTYAYLSTSKIDIYFATSMRKALDFVTNAGFVEETDRILKRYGFTLLYFDPTQSYLDDRIQKGLIESMMIRRCKIVVYNAQQQETFGKDAEAGIGLAHQKPVIIYVPRMIFNSGELQKFYDIIDTAGYEKKSLSRALKETGYLDEAEYYEFVAHEVEKGEAIKEILGKSTKLNQIVDKITEKELKEELETKGYDTTDPEIASNLRKFAFEEMLRFENRALLFKDLHPLSFQISPIDGIARGVFVTRTTEETAGLIKNLLIKSLEYEIKGDDEDDPNYLLVDKTTKSPIRVLPKDISLEISLSRVYEGEN